MIVLYIVIVLGLVFLAAKGLQYFAEGRKEKMRIRVEEKAREDVERMIAVLVADRELARHFQEQLNEALRDEHEAFRFPTDDEPKRLMEP